ncbi:AzlC family ABC transporter permease [Fusibacter ferrireducens]|uniref:AzlC family ABC transporter permease n=1 Tax=Fusibacter ferrireducens TaxID=2785058 RepID=A0ABR9ZUR7_9FIRM|nr:AzlC family ABC transporter permease [Fusibacter ferrireducens]MBF4694178.1 AzlC family ABC transporter permease [Fusibacter ferrireducens]
MTKTLRFAFIKTIPVLFGYLFLGIAFGLLLQRAGYNFIWAFFISTFVFAGSMQFVLISFLGSSMSFVSIILMTLSINSRHIFYGLSFIEKFKHMGKAYPYMIFSLTDETYSLLCGTQIPEDLQEDKVFFAIASLNQSYWVIGSVLGGLLGEMIFFNTTGIDFAMTALFVVIFIEQWLASKIHIPALIGVFCGVISLIVFGPNRFILPALISTIGLIILFRKNIQSREEAQI